MKNFNNSWQSVAGEKLKKEQDTKRYFHPNNGFGQYKKTAIDILKETTTILQELEINYCLISGTLLGQVRHNDFIPWDDDIDLLVDNSIFDKIQDFVNKCDKLNVLMREKKNIVKVCSMNGMEIPENKIVSGWKEHGLREKKYCWPFIDLFTYTQKDDRLFFFDKEWDTNEFFPLKKINFLGIETFVPKNPDYFLKRNFGPNYMTEMKSSHYCHKVESNYRETRTVYVNN